MIYNATRISTILRGVSDLIRVEISSTGRGVWLFFPHIDTLRSFRREFIGG